MTLHFNNAELYGFRNGNESLYVSDSDYHIPGGDIEDISITERANVYKDSAKILLNNNGGKYSGVVGHGDRIQLSVGEVGANEGYGEGGYGVGPYGSSKTIDWVGMVRPFNIEGQGADIYDMQITAEDYPASVMGSRRVYATFEGRQIVGTDGIVNELINEHAPELDTTELPDLAPTTTIFIHGQTLLKVVAELARRANCVLHTFLKSVEFTVASEITPEFTITPDDYSTFNYKSNDDQLYNSVRVEGGTGISIEEQAQQTTVDGYERVTDSSRILYQVDTRKSELDRVELWTRRQDTGDGVTVRLQRDDGGAPINVGSTTSDIAKKTLSQEFLSTDDFTTFIFPSHTLPEPRPWLIIESDGSTGQDIGINTSSGDPGVIPYYPYDIIVQVQDPDSVELYRLREEKITDDTLGTFDAARDTGNSALESNKDPVETLSARAEVNETLSPPDDKRMHNVRPGDVIRVSRPTLDVDDDFVVTEVVDNYHGSTIERDFTMHDISSL